MKGHSGVPRGDGTLWANEERTSAPCPDTCQTNLRGVVNSCREPPLYSTLSSLQSGASRTVPLFVVPMRVHRPAPGPLHGATDDDAERASSLREARHGPEHDARREETPLDRSPKPGRVRLARVASGAGKEDSTQSLGGDLAPRPEKTGGKRCGSVQRAAGSSPPPM